MESKTIEIRDSATFIPALATRLKAIEVVDHYLVEERGGWSNVVPQVVLTRLDNGASHIDIYGWGTQARTMPDAHEWITAHWDEIKSGDVVDVQFNNGETAVKKVSERFTSREQSEAIYKRLG